MNDSQTARWRSTWVALIAVVIAAVAAFGFAAANTVPDTSAGDGEGTISGYTISNISWQLDAGHPGEFVGLSMTVTPKNGAPNAGTVLVSLNETSPAVSCTGSSASTAWTCNLAGHGVTVEQATSLRVTAAE